MTLEFGVCFDPREAGFFQVRSEAIRLVKLALDAGGIDLPEPAYRVQLSRGAAPVLPATAPLDEAPLPEGASSVEQAVNPQVAQEQALSAGQNLLKPDAPKE